jgi:hypothetical protein
VRRPASAAAAVALLAALAGCTTTAGGGDGAGGGPPTSGGGRAPAGRTVVSAVWSSGPRGAPRRGAGEAVLVAIRAARQDGYDRLVFEFRDGLPGYQARYVSKVTAAEGAAVALDGAAFLLLAFDGASAGDAGLAQRDLRPRFGTLRQVRLVDQGDGRVRFGVGIDAVSGYRAYTLTGPDRVVIDLAA